MEFWNELTVTVLRTAATEPAQCIVTVLLAAEGTTERVQRARRIFLIESPEAQDIDALQAWTVAMVGQIYAALATSVEMRKPAVYPNTSSRT